MKRFDFMYRVERSKRKTLAITVLSDCSVRVRSPLWVSDEEIESRIERRGPWIRAQVDYFAAFNPKTTPRHYLAGESHLYLGKTYRLKTPIGEDSVARAGGYLVVPTRDGSSASVREALDGWYRAEAKRVFMGIYARLWEKFQYQNLAKPRLIVKRMKTRWGSLSASGTLSLNPDLVRASKSCIEYVICHELCHVEFPSHDSNFYAKLEKMLSDWEERKKRLEMTMK